MNPALPSEWGQATARHHRAGRNPGAEPGGFAEEARNHKVVSLQQR